MKKFIIPTLALPLLIVCCTKEASVSKGTHATIVNVTDASEGMDIARTSFAANELITANYTVAGADSIQWSIQDSVPHYPNTDTAYYPGSDTLYNPDSTYYPGGNGSTYTPGDDSSYVSGGDSSYVPADTLENGHTGGYDTTYTPGGDSTYVPVDSTSGGHNNGNGSYIVTTRNGYVEIKISKKGGYVLVAKAYKRNADGTYTLIKKGYIKFNAF